MATGTPNERKTTISPSVKEKKGSDISVGAALAQLHHITPWGPRRKGAKDDEIRHRTTPERVFIPQLSDANSPTVMNAGVSFMPPSSCRI
ncbi:MAG: hypothetical protein L6R42_004619 [Xanthoria sp. 1 TBL-2021]|nr:MAG: hypothetical protein L6R42_004619 [Xanthoria sp. 1 TBL-2021]